MSKDIFIGIMIILVLVTGTILYINHNNRPATLIMKSVKIDTVYINITPKVIKIDSLRANRINVDTLSNIGLNYRADADTIHFGDTIKISFSYPANSFSIDMRPKRDSIMIEKIHTFTEHISQEEWWENPMYVLLGFVIGLISALI